jgi:ParB family chromosome partitioning protein
MSQSPFSLKLNNVALLLDRPNGQSEDNFNRQNLIGVSSTLPLNLIILPPSQPRRYFDPLKQQELIASIREHGILQPLLVRPLEKERYELVAGERRYRAATEIGLEEVPVIVKSLTDSMALQIALIENLQRVDLNLIEETEGILKLLALATEQSVEETISLLYRMQNEAAGKITENVLSSSIAQVVLDVFQTIGTITWESFISTRLRLLNLPEDIIESLRSGKIEYTKALAISKIKDDEQRQDFLSQAIEEQWSLSQIKEKIKSYVALPSSATFPISRIREFTSRLKQSKAYKNPKTWKKIESYLEKIEILLETEANES